MRWSSQGVSVAVGRQGRTVPMDRRGTAGLPRRLSPLARQEGSWSSPAVVQGRFKKDVKWVTEPSFPGRALLHLFGFPQCKHRFLDIFNNRSSSHTPAFAFLPPLLKPILCVAGWEVPRISIDGRSDGLQKPAGRHRTFYVVAEKS